MSLFTLHIKDRGQCYASLHSNIHEYLWRHEEVKRDIGKTFSHKLPIYYKYICLCWVFKLFGMICCVPNVLKTLLHGFNSDILYNVYPLYNITTFLSQCNEAEHWDLPFIGAKWRHLWIVFSLNPGDNNCLI